MLHSIAEAANAISAVKDAKDAGERMRGEAKEIASHHKDLEYLEELEKTIVEVQKNLDVLKQDRQDSEENMTDAWKWVQDSMNDRLHAELITLNAEADLAKQPAEEALRADVRAEEANCAAAQAEHDAAQAALERLESTASNVSGVVSERELAQAAAKAIAEVQYDENRLDEAEEKVDAYVDGKEKEVVSVGGTLSSKEELRLQRAETALEAAEASLDAARERLEARMEKQEALADAQADEKDALDNYMAARKNLEEAQAFWKTTREDIEATQQELQELQKDLQDLQLYLDGVFDGKGMETGMRYFSWKDSNGKSGHQVYEPVSFYVQQGDLSYGLQAGRVLSHNKAAADGKAEGFTDTTLSVAQRNRNEEFTVTYGLDVNVPTGTSKMSSAAIVPDDLADIGRFGEGWQVTPRIKVEHKIGEEDTWTFETAYSFKNSYAYDKARPDAVINPGSEWGKSLEWLHAGQKWQMIARFSHGNYGRTQYDTLNYREGDAYDLGLYYNRVLSEKQELLGYYRYEIGHTSQYYGNPQAESLDGQAHTRYYGLEWKYDLSSQQTLRLMGNAMQAGGRSYDSLAGQDVGGRKRYGLLFGYDLASSENDRFSAEVERFYLKYGGGNSYRGWNLFLWYQKYF